MRTHNPESSRRLDEYIASGARVVAVAVRPFTADRAPASSDEMNLQYVGALCFRDPDKPGVAAALADLGSLGIRVKVITGDHERAARILCDRAGLNVRESIDGEQLEHLCDEALRERLNGIDLFARISPVQKERIVRVHRSAGDTVAFWATGSTTFLRCAPAMQASPWIQQPISPRRPPTSC